MNQRAQILPEHFFLKSLVVLYFFLLLFFGKEFTKFSVIGPIYLHDLFLIIIAFLCLNTGKIYARFLPICFILLIAFLYLLYSFAIYLPHGEMIKITIRQFFIFFYLFCSLLIFNVLVRSKDDIVSVVWLIKWIAFASVILQVIFIAYGYLFIHGFSLFEQGEYNYFSPLTIFGIISYGAYVLAFEPHAVKRYGKFIFALILSTSLGHSSAFFALFVIIMVHLFIKITPLQSLIAVFIILFAILMLFLLPQFNDANAGWRLLYWKHVLLRLTLFKYGILGYGFGQPYMTPEYAEYLNEVLHSPIMLDNYAPMARYLAPPHNSLLSFAFHIGLLRSFLLLMPLRQYFKRIFFKPISDNPFLNFLPYLLSGCLVWICFNVILELPHSAIFFWLVYFSNAYFLKVIND